MDEKTLFNVEDLKDFLDFGTTIPHATIRKSPPEKWRDKDWVHWNRQNEVQHHVFSESLAIKQVLNSLYNSMDDIVQSGKVKSIAISGGMDSRLLLGILHKNHRSFLNSTRVYTRIHPLLTKETDRDCLTAMALASKFDFDVEFETTDSFPSAYLVTPYAPCLSGLWGGELLGGQLFDASSFSIEEIQRAKRSTHLKKYLELNKELLENGQDLAIYFDLISKTGLSAMYQSPTWLYPMDALNWTATPFLDSSFLNTLFSVNSNLLKNYNFYSILMTSEFPDFMEIPVNNPMLPSAIQQSIGIEPKSLPIKKYLPTNKLLDNVQLQILEFIDKESPSSKFGGYLKSVISLV